MREQIRSIHNRMPRFTFTRQPKTFNETHLQGNGKFLDQWYCQFNRTSAIKYAIKKSVHAIVLSAIWSIFVYKLGLTYPDQAKQFEADFIVKVMTFLIGLLISLTLKESLDRYKACLGALIDFRDEFRSFWYHAQVPLVRCPAARLLIDIHMVAYSLSVVRFLVQKAGIKTGPSLTMVQQEFRACALFCDDGPQLAFGSNPSYQEIILLSMLRSLGILDQELLRRFRDARMKVHMLITAQRVKTPNTSAHLLHLVVHIFLLLIPITGSKLCTKMMAPLVALVLLPLMRLSEELEDPFGTDQHDLPWPMILGTVTHCSLTPSSRDVLFRVLHFFNNGSMTGNWDLIEAEELLGRKVICESTQHNPHAIQQSRQGQINFGLYLTADDLLNIDVVGNQALGNPEILFSPDLEKKEGGPVFQQAEFGADKPLLNC